MPAFAPRPLGRTGLTVGPIGFGSSYGVPARAIERAVAAGCNYLCWGSIQRGGMAEAIRNLPRDQFRLALCTYSRIPMLMRRGVEKDLRALRCDYADVLLLGWWNAAVWPAVLDAGRELKERGLVRHLALSTHHLPFLERADDALDVYHLRYSAVHPAAETEVFPKLGQPKPGIVAFTATSWGRLCNPRKTPPGERTPAATDCYRFALTQPAVDLCMTGPADEAQAEAAVRAVELGPLDAGELAWMRRVGAGIRGL